MVLTNGRRSFARIAPLSLKGISMTHRYRPRGFARRVDEIEPFRVVEVLTRATQLAAGGRDIVHLASRHLRFSYTTGMDRLELAVERLAAVLA